VEGRKKERKQTASSCKRTNTHVERQRESRERAEREPKKQKKQKRQKRRKGKKASHTYIHTYILLLKQKKLAKKL
jgi:hypothetical protein